MERRDFIQMSAFAGLGLSISAGGFLSACEQYKSKGHSLAYRKLVYDLLKDWCEGLINWQVIDPVNPGKHGLLECPVCDTVHTRCFDAVYPLMYLAKTSGEKKYLDAAIAVFEWSYNVTRPDGAWTNELKPKSWDGITAFGAVSLAEALKYHGDLLDDSRRSRWLNRLKDAAEFTYQKFKTIDTANINYGASCVYVFYLLGNVLNEPKYLDKSKEFAKEVKTYFTKPNAFIYGEIQPDRHRLSKKDLHGIDLGYNIEETLNSLVLYSFEAKDEELLLLVTRSMNTHLEFMLPDGGWDNSWGTRLFKWTYWGSRTSDGSQQCLTLLANRNPACGTAAVKYTELLKRCTFDGLLHGGLHYHSHGIKPCIHHTFEHAKPLASLLEHWDQLPEINTNAPLPRAVADGIKYFEEIDTSLFARGDWRGTVTAYDSIYSMQKDLHHASGGSLSLLYHNKVGLLCAASMPIYKLGEVYNQQKAPGEDIALTPRIETYKDGEWFTNLFDLEATFSSDDDDKRIEYTANVQLKNEGMKVVTGTASDFKLNYGCDKSKMTITVYTRESIQQATAFVLPIISPTVEQVNQVSDKTITIKKTEGTVKVSCNVPIKVKNMPKSRTFNMVPGVEAVPIVARFYETEKQVRISIEVV